MNCQPSFRTGSIPVAAPTFDDLGGLALRTDPRPDRRGGDAAGPRRRVPDCDIVDVGSSRPAACFDEPVDVGDLAVEATSRATTRSSPAAAPHRTYTKPLLALLVLQMAVAGGLHLRKRMAEAHVIVVPAPTDERAVIT